MNSAQESYIWFFRGEYERVVRTAHFVLGDPDAARDIAQEAFTQLFLHWKKVAHYDRPDAWVRRVAVRLAVRRLKRERLRSRLERSEDSPPAPSENHPEVLEAVRRLSPAQRAAVVLFYYQDCPIAEISDVLGCSPSTVSVHLHRARRNLGEMLTKEVGNVG